ncbi:MAG: 50S ribosomal protein L23 [Alphaproteobacteria bacterium]|jgi:large subunit ribosomal protein L23|nr:50S ribosomal protein L23 [Alphaproteobacteria bacterium]
MLKRRKSVSKNAEQPALSHYRVIVAPHITEKSTLLGENQQVVFKVARDADKPTIKAAVESLFKVEVSSVNTMNVQGKVKRFRGRLGQRAAFKKAIICLKPGSKIDFSAGV